MEEKGKKVKKIVSLKLDFKENTLPFANWYAVHEKEEFKLKVERRPDSESPGHRDVATTTLKLDPTHEWPEFRHFKAAQMELDYLAILESKSPEQPLTCSAWTSAEEPEQYYVWKRKDSSVVT